MRNYERIARLKKQCGQGRWQSQSRGDLCAPSRGSGLERRRHGADTADKDVTTHLRAGDPVLGVSVAGRNATSPYCLASGWNVNRGQTGWLAASERRRRPRTPSLPRAFHPCRDLTLHTGTYAIHLHRPSRHQLELLISIAATCCTLLVIVRPVLFPPNRSAHLIW